MKNLSVVLVIVFLSILSSGFTLFPDNITDFVIGFVVYFAFFALMLAPAFSTKKKTYKYKENKYGLE
jgi:hypothetical protein